MFFGRKKARERLEDASAKAKAALDGQDLAEVRALHEELRSAWSESGYEDAIYALMSSVEGHLEALTQRDIERRARPCARCGGGEIAVSGEFRWEELDARTRAPPMRMFACRACGTAELVLCDVGQLVPPVFPTIVRVPPNERGPFR